MGLRRVFASFEDGAVPRLPPAAHCPSAQGTFGKPMAGSGEKEVTFPRRCTAQAFVCSGTQCEVACNGEKRKLECPEGEGHIIWSDTPTGGQRAKCGKAPPCYPFCDV